MQSRRPVRPIARTLRHLALAAVLVAMLVPAAPVAAREVPAQTSPEAIEHGAVGAPQRAIEADITAQRVLVKFRSGVSGSQRFEAGRLLGYRIVREIPQIGWSVAESTGSFPAAVADRLRLSGLAVQVGLDAQAELAGAPDDPYYPTLWGLENTGQSGGTPDADIDMEAAWDASTGATGVVVAVVDTGIDTGHPDLAANIWVNADEIPGNGLDDDSNGYIDDINGWNFAGDEAAVFDRLDGDGHGTHVAGTIGAVGDNGVGVTGVNWDVSLMSCKFITPFSGSVSAGAEGIVYAVDNGASVISNSWSVESYVPMLSDAIDYARQAGVIVTAAAANDGEDLSDFPEWPAAIEATNVVTVAATDRDDDLASFSNYDPVIVDIAAPGVETTSTIPTFAAGLLVEDAPFKVAYHAFPVESVIDDSAREAILLQSLTALDTALSTPILIVDDSYATTRAGESAGARAAVYQTALASLGYTDVTLHTVEDSGAPTDGQLAGSTVVWFTGKMGYHYYSVGSLDSTDRTRIGTFLDAGGRLLLSSGDVGLDLEYMARAPSWYHSYLHATCIDYESWTPDLAGTSGGILDGTAGSVALADFDGGWPASSDAIAPYDADASAIVDWNGYAAIGGTSMATPHVSGAIALVLAAHPGITPADAWTRVESSADLLPGLEDAVARGARLNVGTAVGEYAAPPRITAPQRFDEFAYSGEATLSWLPRSDEASGTTYEAQVATPIDLLSNGGFEDGTLSGWATGGDEPFVLTQDPAEVHTGAWGVRSGDIGNSEDSELSCSVVVPSGGAWLTFDYWFDAEDGWEHARLDVDGTRRWHTASDSGWSSARVWLDEGARTLRWTYDKDSIISEGRDAFGIDDVQVSQYSWADIGGIGPGATDATFTVPATQTENGAVRVRAVFEEMTSTWTMEYGLTFYQGDIIPPAAPTLLEATRSGDDVALSWANPTDPDFAGVRVLMSTASTPTAPDQVGAQVTYEGTGTAALDEDVYLATVEQTRYYAAFAFDTSGNFSQGIGASIDIDTIAPAGDFVLADGASYTPSVAVALDSAVTGADAMQIDVGSGYGALQPYVAYTPITLPDTDGIATVRVRYVDDAGNTPLVVSHDIMVDIGAPHDDRLADTNRYTTAIDISRNAFADGSVSTVVLATGEDYADALGASALAGAYGSPVLLTKRTSLPAGLMGPTGELERLGVDTVVIIGGDAAVSSEVQDALDIAGYTTSRIAGANRYETAADVADVTLAVRGSSPAPTTVFVARGDEFADALSVAPIAYAGTIPVLLVKPGSVPGHTATAITDGGYTHAVVVGGEAAILPETADALGIGYERRFGATRYETAADVATWAEGEGLASFDYVGVATGTGFADALGGGAAVGANGGVVLLTRQASVPAATYDEVQAHDSRIRTLWVFGGTAAVSDAVRSTLVGLLP